MSAKWVTVAPGIRARDHATRKYGVKLDRYFTLRFSVEGRQVEDALGWASEGWTLARAQEELGKLRTAKRTGQGPTCVFCRNRHLHRDRPLHCIDRTGEIGE